MPPQVPKSDPGAPVLVHAPIHAPDTKSNEVSKKSAEPPKQDPETAAKNAQASKQHAKDTKNLDTARAQILKDQLAKKLPEKNTLPNDAEKKGTEATAKSDASKIAAPPGSPFGAGKKVLMLGDSHSVMGYGKKMKELVKGTGSDVTVDAKVGARPKDFTNKIGEHIRKENPDTIVVSLGTNFRETKMTQGQVNVQVERITKAVRDAGSNAKIIWVGPPRLAEDMKDNGTSLDSFDKMMTNAMGSKGQYVSSNPYTNYKGRDGVHYETAQAETWANAVFSQINSPK